MGPKGDLSLENKGGLSWEGRAPFVCVQAALQRERGKRRDGYRKGMEKEMDRMIRRETKLEDQRLPVPATITLLHEPIYNLFRMRTSTGPTLTTQVQVRTGLFTILDCLRVI